MARDRKRAKQRRDRGAALARRSARAAGASGASNGARADGPLGDGAEEDAQRASGRAPGTIERADLPGSLGHAGAEVDEFDAALVRGAAGTPLADEQQAELEDGAEDALREPGGPSAPGGSSGGRDRGGDGDGGGGGGGGELARPSGAPLRGGNRVIGFARASWAELQRVQWPDRRQVTQATAVVIGFVAIAGAYLGLADYVAKEIVELIL